MYSVARAFILAWNPQCNFLIVQDTLAYRVAYKAALLTKDKLQFAWKRDLQQYYQKDYTI